MTQRDARPNRGERVLQQLKKAKASLERDLQTYVLYTLALG